MPILTQPDTYPKRRRPWLPALLAVPGLVLLLLLGLVAQSWEKPVHLALGGRGIRFQHSAGSSSEQGFGSNYHNHTDAYFQINLPDALGSGSYQIWAYWW